MSLNPWCLLSDLRAVNRRLFRCLLLGLLSFAVAPAAWAQNASIIGTVADASGGVVIGARVQVVNGNTSMVVATVKSDGNGNYSVRALPPGRYQVSIQAPGFDTETITVTLAKGQELIHNAHLEITGARASIVVRGDAGSIPNANPNIAVGPFANTPLQDLPYSITVVPSTLIQNLQANNPEDLAKVVPQITNVLPQQNNTGNPFFYIRGFSISQFTNGAGVTYDGWLGPTGGQFDTTLEDKEQVEVLSGVDGFLYGIGSVGGNINYVLKRPTETRFASITAGDNEGENGYLHGDFGGPLDKSGRVAYRLNVVGQYGPTSLKDQSITRDLVSGAVDVHARHDLLLRFNFAHSDYHIYGGTPVFDPETTLIPYPRPANPGDIFSGYWDQFVDHTDTAGAKVIWTPKSFLTFRTGYAYTHELRPDQTYVGYSVTDYRGDATPFGYLSGLDGGSKWNTQALYGFVDVKFSLLGIRNKLTAGYNGSYEQSYALSKEMGWASNIPPNNFYNEQPIPPPTFIYQYITPYRGGGLLLDNIMVGDQIDFGSHFGIMAGGNLAIDKQHSFTPTGPIRRTSSYDASKITPAVAFLYKPQSWVTTYVSFQQSLQPGTAVINSGTTVYTNNGTILPPYVGNQYEVGVKATLEPGVLLTAALFDIDKANQYTLQNPDGTYTEYQDGREVHKGLELTVMGKVRPDLTIVGGVDFISARIRSNPATPSQDGLIPNRVSPTTWKLYSEYDLPHVRGLTFDGGISCQGSQYADDLDGQSIRSYVVGNLGARYTTYISDEPIIFRLDVNNLTDEWYWVTNATEGLPRTILATVEFRF